MQLGAFSISLALNDLGKPKAFYETLGFAAKGGGAKWQIRVNGTTVIGLFKGMIPNNILTFNPGWAQDTRTCSRSSQTCASSKRR